LTIWRPSRRSVLLSGIASAFLAPAWRALATPLAGVAGKNGLHGLSVFGELKYPADFGHFDYVNPDAPKGGSFVFTAPNWYYNQSPNTFNTLNGYTFRGDGPPRIELVFDTLMVPALDEPDSLYGLVAKSVSVSEDGNRFTFDLREEARFHDGTPLTSADVVFSFETLKQQGHPDISQSIRQMSSVTADGDHRVIVTFTGEQSVKEPLIVAGTLPIFSKAFYAGLSFEAATMTPPLGSGPYRVGAISPGRSIAYERVADYWAKDLPVTRGRYNFDHLRVEFYQDPDVEFEAFAKGALTWREEPASKNWATRYTFPAVRDGKVKKPDFPSERRADMYGWFFNLRRAKFADLRTRRAIGMVFDFTWTNKNLFYGLYQRSTSFFEGSDFAATGLPSPAEVALLQPFAESLPPGILDGLPVMPPLADGSGRDRKLMQVAVGLLRDAGWQPKGNRLVNAAGEPLAIEFLIQSPAFERVLTPYLANLKAIGVDASMRLVDAAQYQRRRGDFQFDIIASRTMFDATPIDGIEQIFGSAVADVSSGSNLAGLKDPIVDSLIATAGRSESREALITSMRALDRVLRAREIWIPAWLPGAHRVACWDIFAWPEAKPAYGFSPETTWWYDRERAAAIGRPG